MVRGYRIGESRCRTMGVIRRVPGRRDLIGRGLYSGPGGLLGSFKTFCEENNTKK